MSATLAQDALLKRLMSMPDRPSIAYPNGLNVEPPRIVVEFPAASQNTSELGGLTQGTAEMIARVETKDGELDTEAKSIATQIVEHFPVGLETDLVTIVQAPSPRTAYQADGVYHIPVIVRGRYHF